MKKYLNLLLCSAILAFAACDNDDDNDSYAEKASLSGILVATTADTSVYTQDETEVIFDFAENGFVNITLKGVKFSDKMPMTIDLQIDSIKYIRDEVNAKNTFGAVVVVPKYNGEPFPRYTFSTIAGEFVSPNLFSLSFTTGNSVVRISNMYLYGNAETISANGNLITILGTDSTFVKEDVKVKFTKGADVATIEMFGVKFAEAMPLTLDMTIGNIAYNTDNGKITFSGDSIIPQAMGADFPRYTITNLQGNIVGGMLEFTMICGNYPVKYSGEQIAE